MSLTGTPNRRAFLHLASVGAAVAGCVDPRRATPAETTLAADGARVGSGTTLAVQEPPPAQPSPASAAGVAVQHQDQSWLREWEDLVAAATREGALSLLTVAGRGYRTMIELFQREFPGIAVQHVAESSPAAWLETAHRTRRAGAAAFDVALVQPDRALAGGTPAGLWAPVAPLLVHPDVLAGQAWRGGMQARFLDAGGVLCFAWEYQVVHAYAVNRDLVQPDEIASVRDLLDSKWKGRVISSDPRIGTGLLSAASVANSWGTDVLERLLVDQRPTFTAAAGRAVVEPLLRGQYAVALGVRPKALREFRDQGLAGAVAFLDLPDADFAATLSLLRFDRAPHAAAAALFANWILTRDGQAILTQSLPTNSARTDVPPFEPDGIGAPGTAYYEPDREANARNNADTHTFVTRLLGRSR